jgi:APA family basic amino acid/polyamine antiporter
MLFIQSSGHQMLYAIQMQCIVYVLLCLSGKYGDLPDYISFVVMFFYIITIGGVFILHTKRPNADRPY